MSFLEKTKDEMRKAEKMMQQESIKQNGIDLAQQVRNAGSETVHQVSEYLSDQAESMKHSGVAALERVENRIKERPGQSIGIAFAAGILASLLLRRGA